MWCRREEKQCFGCVAFVREDRKERGEDAGLREWGEAVESQGEENKNKNPADQGSQFSIF